MCTEDKKEEAGGVVVVDPDCIAGEDREDPPIQLQVTDRRHHAPSQLQGAVGQALIHSPTPADLLRAALEQKADVAMMKGLLELQLQWEAAQAEKAYNAAMAEFKKVCPPTVVKDKTVTYGKGSGATTYNHASLGNELDHITNPLGEFGFSVEHDVDQGAKEISVTCIITHAMGHEKRTTLKGPPDTTGSKNSVQAIMSTVTYLRRYSLECRLGIATKDDDTDGVPPPAAPVPEGHSPIPARAEKAIGAFRKWIATKEGDTTQKDLEKFVGMPVQDWAHTQYEDLGKLFDEARKLDGIDDQREYIAKRIGG
jgi:hypothetical protein